MTDTSEVTQSSFGLTFQADIAWLAIDTPGESVNILKASFIEEMSAVLATLEANPPAGMVIYSKKPGNFVAGADIAMFDRFESAKESKQLVEQGQAVFSRLADLPFPVIAAIHGPCLGGGLELALACDFRLCSDDPKTCLGLPELQLGVLPGLGGTQRLPRLIGLLPALEMILTSKKIRPRQALRLGLVDACVHPDGLSEAAVQLLHQQANSVRKQRLSERVIHFLTRFRPGRHLLIQQARAKAQRKARHHYPAIDAVLDVIQAGLDEGMVLGMVQEAQWFGQLVMSPQSRALRAIFHETNRLKRELKQGETAQVSQIAVLGGGLMGAGISYVSVDKAKKRVRVKDVSHQGVLHAFGYIDRALKKKQRRKILSAAQVRETMARLSGEISFKGFEQADIVIEAVFEDLSLKQEMVELLEGVTGPDAVFATNTSSLPIHQIAEVAARPENVVGLHYFSPVEKMPLVEVIPHEKTSAQTVSQVLALAYAQGKTPIVVKDSAGFYVNRILAQYINGALQCLAQGEPIEVIDQAMVEFGFPVGPLTLLDEVGFDVAIKISPILTSELGERFNSPDFLQTMVADKRKGRKSGLGFYRYRRQGKQADPAIYSLLNVTRQPQLSQDEIVKRCLLPLLAEAVLCLDEQVIRCPGDGDIGAIFGIGFPPFLGGPFRYMDDTGLKQIAAQLDNLPGSDYAMISARLNKDAESGTFFHQN